VKLLAGWQKTVPPPSGLSHSKVRRGKRQILLWQNSLGGGTVFRQGQFLGVILYYYTGYYVNLPPLQRSNSSFCLLFPCVNVTSLGKDMHSHEWLLVLLMLLVTIYIVIA